MKLLLVTVSLFIFMVAAKAQAPQLWGTCGAGGILGYGVIIKSDSTGTNFHVVYSFDSISGSLPLGNLCSGGNGKLYGVTSKGGYGDSCVCFSYDTATGIYTNFHDLFQNIDSGWDAQSGMMLASDGLLYGLAAAGGLSNYGVLYRVDPAIDTYSPIYNFSSSTGDTPEGGLIQLSDGKLYGMTNGGGQNSGGVIFSFNPADSTYLDLYDFSMTSGGSQPYLGSLLKASDGKLYGLTYNGSNSYGVIFSYDITSGIYSDLHDFYSTDGAHPYGSLIQATNGLLYGMTYQGGTNDGGVIFSYNLSTQDYSVLYNFNSTDGFYPLRSLTQASNGKLFGTTSQGGFNYGGTAFSFDILNITFTKLIDFAYIGCSLSSCDILETGAMPLATAVVPIYSDEEFATYPNPATDEVTVSGKILTPKTQVELWDNQGKRIVDFTIKDNTLNVSMLPSGFYILKITSGNSSAMGKFVKE